jgi:hypothetical protein
LNDSSAQLVSSEATEKVLAYLKFRFDSLKYAYDQNSKVEEIDNELGELGIVSPLKILTVTLLKGGCT